MEYVKGNENIIERPTNAILVNLIMDEDVLPQNNRIVIEFYSHFLNFLTYFAYLEAIVENVYTFYSYFIFWV